MAPTPRADGSTVTAPATERRLGGLLLLLNAVTTVVLASVCWIALNASRHSYEQRAWQAADNMVRAVQQGIEIDLARIELTLRSIALEHARRVPAQPQEFERTLREHQELLPEVDSLHVTDATGLVVFGPRRPEAVSVLVGDRRYFLQAYQQATDDLIVSAPLRSRVTGRWVLVVVRRLAAADGSFAGVVYATLPVEHFYSRLAAMAPGPLGAVTLRGENLELVARYVPERADLGEVGTSHVSRHLQEAIASSPQEGRFRTVVALDQIERATVYRRVGNHPLIVLAGIASRDYLQPWRRELLLVCGLALLAALGFYGSSAFLYRSWRRDARAARALKEREAQLDRTGRLASVGGWELDLETDKVTWSRQTRRIYEVPDDFTPTRAEGLSFISPESRAKVSAAYERALSRGEPWNMELSGTSGRGRPIWLRHFGEVEFDRGRPVRLIGAVQDVTEEHERRLALEHEQAQRAAVERHAAELDELLKERSQMLEVLAHEVRQPLNNASAALQSAATALAETGESTARTRIERAQLVMGQVLASVDNTLAVASLLSRGEPIARQDTDIDTLIALAVGDMPASERHRIRVERQAVIRTESMDLGLMRLALRNLLSNALKYSPSDAPVTIRLSDSDDPLAVLIDVEDHGPGVPPELVPRLFERGVRGNVSAQGSMSHGIGLFIVERVMALHGGSAVVARNSPEGLTMRLVLRPQPEDDE